MLFPSAKLAGAFFTASAQQWPACRQYTHTQSGSLWDVGDIQHEQHTEHHHHSAERQRPRLGLWPRAVAPKQRPHRRQHMQCQPRGLRCQHRNQIAAKVPT